MPQTNEFCGGARKNVDAVIVVAEALMWVFGDDARAVAEIQQSLSYGGALVRWEEIVLCLEGLGRDP